MQKRFGRQGIPLLQKVQKALIHHQHGPAVRTAAHQALHQLRRCLLYTSVPDELPAAVQAAVPTGSNLRGSAAYRTHLVGVLVKRAVQALGNLEVL